MEHYNKGLTGCHFIVSAGPTHEYLDPVRYISNPSSGKMGFYLAKECLKYSPRLTFIHGPIEAKFIPLFGKPVSIESTEELLQAIIEELDLHKNRKTVLIMAAAPGDYRTKTIALKKIKKNKNEELTLNLVKNPDILLEIEKNISSYPNLFRIGFAAESHNALMYGQEKLRKKNLDMIVINNIKKNNITKETLGFQSDENQVDIFHKNGKYIKISKTHKSVIAEKILEEISSQFPGNRDQGSGNNE